jgi:protoheme IX farnesyltransferase
VWIIRSVRVWAFGALPGTADRGEARENKLSTPSIVLGEERPRSPSAAKWAGARGLAQALLNFYELTKPNITFLVVLSAAAGFCLGTSGPLNYLQFAHAMAAVALLCSGLGALNQYMERHLDGRMRRTAHRPLPSGKLEPLPALLFGIGISVLAEVYLATMLNPLAALLGFMTLASYLFVYTPLKTRTPWCTFLGAFPGAMPPLVGWVAARGQISLGGWILFAILFLWQFPHFHSIAMLYREDYERAGIRMLPVVEPDGRATSRQIVAYTLMLLPASLAPGLIKMSGAIYFVGAMVLGVVFFYFAWQCALAKTKVRARALLLASVFYLPILFGLMVLNQMG